MSGRYPYIVYRDASGRPKWFMPLYECFLVLTGRLTLHKAWQAGLDEGSAREYIRLIVNKVAVVELQHRYGDDLQHAEESSNYDRWVK